MEIVYIETTVVSHLVANPSRDLVTAGQQQATRDWWRLRRPLFQCVTSDETLAESARGDAAQARLRLDALAEMPALPVSLEAEKLAVDFLRTGALPAAARSDAVHLAVASIARTDYLLTWHCRHNFSLSASDGERAGVRCAFQSPASSPAGARSRDRRMGVATGLHPA